MITLIIEDGFFQAISHIGLLWCGLTGLAILASVIILCVVLYQRHQEKKKGEEHAYRNY